MMIHQVTHFILKRTKTTVSSDEDATDERIEVRQDFMDRVNEDIENAPNNDEDDEN